MMLILPALCTWLYTVAATGTKSKCGKFVETNKNVYNYILLFPITTTKNNQSYNMGMVIKEIAYKNEYLKSPYAKYVGWITYDYCNDMSTFIEIIINILLDQYYTRPTFIIHAQAEFLKNAQPILNYFQVISQGFITNERRNDIPIYSGMFMLVYHEQASGFLELLDDTPYESFIIVILCYPNKYICECLPIEDDIRASASRLNLLLFLGEYTDLGKLEKTIKKVNRSNFFLKIRRKSANDWPSLQNQLEHELQLSFSGNGYLGATFGSNWYNQYKYSKHLLNCQHSSFIDEEYRNNTCKHLWNVKITNFNRNLDRTTYMNDISLKNFSCKPTCSVGYTIRFDEHKFIWECQQCVNNSVKHKIGNDQCIQCLLGWAANDNKTVCVDTYRTFSLKINDKKSIIMISLSFIMSIVIFISIVMFIKYQKTPVVKSSNLRLSFIQLFSHLLVGIIMPVLFIGDPDELKCTLQPICIGILLTTSTTVTLSKTRTLLHIFQTGITPRISTNSKRTRKITELFVVFLFALCTSCILIASFQYKKPGAEYFVSNKQKYRETHCNTNDHILLQFGFILILLLFNSIQAIRARHLPANFKETRVIILTNILSIVIVANVLWLSFYQKYFYWKAIFQFYAIFIFNGINFLFLYGYKIYILLLLPEKNTREYFRSCVRGKIIKQVNRMQMQSIS